MKKTYDREAVGRRIREKRTILGLTQEELSERIGRVPKYCADIERGNCGMSIETMLALCDVLNMTPDYLFFGEMSESDKEIQTSETEAILSMLDKCSPAKRHYALELLKLYLKSADVE